MPLSYSQLRRYRTCPRQYEFSNVKKIPWGISEGESFGASVHVALKRWGEAELAISGERVAGSGLPQLFPEESSASLNPLMEEKLIQIWHDSFAIDAYPTRLEADFARRRGEEIMRKFFPWWAACPRTLLSVEQSFKIPVDGATFAGRLDRMEETADGIVIIDYKTTRPCTQDEADADLQLSLYALACQELTGKPCTSLTLLFLSEEGVVERTTKRGSGQLRDALTQIRLIRERMEAKDYRPTPSLEACKRCPYRRICDSAVR
ncbi:MAG: PD-(D/E)XK nuclease family protein [Candidatus Peregrinibacteria bacterium]